MENIVQTRSHFSVHTALAFILGAMCFASYGQQQASPSARLSSADTKTTAAANTSSPNLPAAAGPGPNEKVCFQCGGTGLVVCRAPGCKEGRVDCPGGCLKLSRGVWTHRNVPGHSPADLWITFRKASGGTMSWNQNHVGNVIAYQNGDPVDTGPCKVCGGTTTVACPSCKGQGKQTCEICSGKKFVPIAWTSTDNPRFNSQPDLIRLKDGQAILGRVAASSGEEKTIITRDKKILHVKASDLLPKQDANSPAVQTISPK